MKKEKKKPLLYRRIQYSYFSFFLISWLIFHFIFFVFLGFLFFLSNKTNTKPENKKENKEEENITDKLTGNLATKLKDLSLKEKNITIPEDKDLLKGSILILLLFPFFFYDCFIHLFISEEDFLIMLLFKVFLLRKLLLIKLLFLINLNILVSFFLSF